jgi:hypothetical protein
MQKDISKNTFNSNLTKKNASANHSQKHFRYFSIKCLINPMTDYQLKLFLLTPGTP